MAPPFAEVIDGLTRMPDVLASLMARIPPAWRARRSESAGFSAAEHVCRPRGLLEHDRSHCLEREELAAELARRGGPGAVPDETA